MSPLTVVCLALACGHVALAELTYYKSYDGSVISEEEVLAADEDYQYWCVNKFESECPLMEHRRIDGSCNNLAAPRAGSGHYRFDRIMDADYSYEATGRIDGGSDVARKIRSLSQALGEVPSTKFTQFLIVYTSFMVKDVAIMLRQDIFMHIIDHPNCCETGGADPQCYNIDIPADDNVHRFSGIRCMNLTYPTSYESQGCVGDAEPFTSPERINFGSPMYDLSQMYGNLYDTINQERTFSGGLLNTTTAAGTDYPWPTIIPRERMTHDGAQNLSSQLFPGLAFHWREHNRIARALTVLNPSWDDEKLFYTARDINIGMYQQILYYEVWPALLGYDNMVRDGIISTNPGLRDPYSGDAPKQYAESLYALRWIHAICGGHLKQMSTNGTVLGVGEIGGLPLRWDLTSSAGSGTMRGYNQGAFRSPAAFQDNVIDPILGERVNFVLEAVSDLGSMDISKGRMLGMPKFHKILQHCDGKEHTTWESFEGYINDDNMAILRNIYTSPLEVDWIVGTWLEELYPGSEVPSTVYCMLLPQFVNMVTADRHWFERPNRPFAFTEAQLAEIRKASLARLMCDNAESIVETGITARPLEVISDENPIVPCSTFQSVNFNVWKETSSSTSSSASISSSDSTSSSASTDSKPKSSSRLNKRQ